MTRPPLPAGRDLTEAELVALVTSLAAAPELWRPHVRHDPAHRTFHQLVDEPNVTAWLICWMPGQDTGFHDHDGSAGVVAVLDGEVREDRLALGPGPASTVAGAGDLLRFGPDDIHRVAHHGTVPATTLHAYSPVLRRMGAYGFDEHGRLLRRALDEGTVLEVV
jgi:predicted metal-dependent enzyme (double-stranded beta helix superfamily)